MSRRTAHPVLPQPGRPLDAAQKLRLAGEILVAYGGVRWHLRRSTLPATLTVLRRAEATAPCGATVEVGRQLGRAVVRTLEPLPTDSRCLMRSLVLLRLLARRGVTVRLVLGVAGGERFAAHAWLEQDGMALLPTGGDTFGQLVEL